MSETIWGKAPGLLGEYTGRRLQVFDLGAFRVARQNVRVTLGELLTQLDLQELCHDGVVGHSHEGRARANPDGLSAAVKAGVAHGVVEVGDQAATIGPWMRSSLAAAIRSRSPVLPRVMPAMRPICHTAVVESGISCGTTFACLVSCTVGWNHGNKRKRSLTS